MMPSAPPAASIAIDEVEEFSPAPACAPEATLDQRWLEETQRMPNYQTVNLSKLHSA